MAVSRRQRVWDRAGGRCEYCRMPQDGSVLRGKTPIGRTTIDVHEVGFLMGLNRGRHAAQDNFVLIVRDTDQMDKDVGFNLKGVSQIRFKEMNDLEAQLTKTIRTYYGLGSE